MSAGVIRLATEDEKVRKARESFEREMKLAARSTAQGEPFDEPVAAARRAVEEAERLLVPPSAFVSAAERVKGEAEERKVMAARLLGYQHTFLDDILRGILPHDLVILGARSGAGKTELAQGIAMGNVQAGKRVHYLALEAEDREIERRSKYKLIYMLAVSERRDTRDLNYVDWYLGRCEHIVGDLHERAERLLKQIATLFTFYRGRSFGYQDLRRMLLSVKDETDLCVVDHLHYIDTDEDESENRAFKDIVKMTRDFALDEGRPVILIVHLKKKDRNDKDLVPDMEQVHGSSDIFKIATKQIMFSPARKGLPEGPVAGNTYMAVTKDRMGGETGLIALCEFDRRSKSYGAHYTLGRQVGEKFEPINIAEVPRWAKHHRPIFAGTTTGALQGP